METALILGATLSKAKGSSRRTQRSRSRSPADLSCGRWRRAARGRRTSRRCVGSTQKPRTLARGFFYRGGA